MSVVDCYYLMMMSPSNKSVNLFKSSLGIDLKIRKCNKNGKFSPSHF